MLRLRSTYSLLIVTLMTLFNFNSLVEFEETEYCHIPNRGMVVLKLKRTEGEIRPLMCNPPTILYYPLVYNSISIYLFD